MAYREKSLSAEISSGASVSASISSGAGISGELSKAESIIEKNYEKLTNKPKINSIELVGDRSFEELGDHTLTNFEILELMKNAGF